MSEKYISRDNLELVIDGLKVGMTADWNENDKNEFGYIENKPFYTEYGVIVDNYSGKGKRPKCNFVAGNKYDVIWNGLTYKGLVCHTDGEYNYIGRDGYPFYINDDGGNGFYADPESGFTVSIFGDVVHQLDEKYIPDSVARVEEAYRIANELSSVKMDVTNPVGTGSFSMNRKDGTAVGDCSHAEGLETTASGQASHAEGYETTASGLCSHVEGRYNVASGENSHAEGGSVFAYGGKTVASGQASHAEGAGTTASGTFSHAEGRKTTASGEASHAEGFGTVAQKSFQHVQGMYNILDTADNGMEVEGKPNGKYAHIVGNGSTSNPSNAHTLDWDGVGWYQGGLQVGGNAQDDGAKNVLLEGDAIPVPASAQVGQVLSVKAVDESGKPTEWETVSGYATDAPVADEVVKADEVIATGVFATGVSGVVSTGITLGQLREYKEFGLVIASVGGNTNFATNSSWRLKQKDGIKYYGMPCFTALPTSNSGVISIIKFEDADKNILSVRFVASTAYNIRSSKIFTEESMFNGAMNCYGDINGDIGYVDLTENSTAVGDNAELCVHFGSATTPCDYAWKILGVFK